jgi:preprotein translocase subunit SecD
MSRTYVMLIVIIVVTLIAGYIVLPNSPGIHIGPFNRSFEIKQGLDLRGGTQVLLEADVPADQEITKEEMQQVTQIVENRVNALGVTEPLVQQQGTRRIIVELPGVEDADQAIATVRETGLLEFIDAGTTYLPEGTIVRTTYPKLESEGATGGPVQPSGTITATPSVTGTTPVTPTATGTSGITATNVITNYVFPTVLTGSALQTARVTTDPTTNKLAIAFQLNDKGVEIFKNFTTAHADNNVQPYYYLSIVLDKQVISSPHIVSPIPEGQGEISGNFDRNSAEQLAIQLRYGALPIPLKIESTRSIGPTLGQDSVARSIRAGIVGLSIVLLFMVLYYRVPGVLAAGALLLYGLYNLALYKLIPVTMTLPAITGFILSTGMAVDANILVFERMKEELRAGKRLGAAIEAGFSRAWTSIRDSNVSTLITCAILLYFGSTFGAGTVRGFAVTLALGVLINLFTAITVTRTFFRLVFDWVGEKLQVNHFLLGA